MHCLLHCFSKYSFALCCYPYLISCVCVDFAVVTNFLQALYVEILHLECKTSWISQQIYTFFCKITAKFHAYNNNNTNTTYTPHFHCHCRRYIHLSPADWRNSCCCRSCSTFYLQPTALLNNNISYFARTFLRFYGLTVQNELVSMSVRPLAFIWKCFAALRVCTHIRRCVADWLLVVTWLQSACLAGHLAAFQAL